MDREASVDLIVKEELVYKIFYVQPGMLILFLSREHDAGATILREGEIDRHVPWTEIKTHYLAVEKRLYKEVPRSAEYEMKNKFSRAQSREHNNKQLDLLFATLDAGMAKEISRGNLPEGRAANLEASKTILRRFRG